MATETPTAPAAPAAPAPSAPPGAPPAQVASFKTPPATQSAPTPPTQQSDNASIQERLRAVAKEAFAPENLPPGKELVTEPNEPAKPVKAEKPAEPKKEKKTVFDSVETKETATRPAPEAAPEAKDRFADVLEPDGATETTKKGWKALKEKANAEIAAAEKRANDALAQIDTFRKATPAEQANVAKLQADLQAAHDRLAILDVSAHPDFHRQYVEPKKKALAEANQLLTDNAVPNAPEIGALLNLPRTEFAKKVNELAATLPPYDQSVFATSMREAYRLQEGQGQALSKAGELQQQLQAQSAQKQKQAFDKTYEVFATKMKPLEVGEHATAEEKAEADAFNSAMAQIRPEAERYAFGKIDEAGVAELASRAAAGKFIVEHAVPKMQREHAALRQLVAEQTAELAAIKAAKNPGTFSGDAGKAPVDPSKQTFADSMRIAREAAARGETIR